MWSFDDQNDLCAYCGYQIDRELDRCPNCNKKLTQRVKKFKQASSSFYLFVILLFSLLQLFVIQVFIGILTEQSRLVTATHLFFVIILAVALVFVFLRKAWAYPIAIGILLLAAVQVTMTTAGPGLLFELTNTPIDGLKLGANRLAISSIYLLQVAAIAINLVLGFFFIGADFVYTQIYMIAQLHPRHISQNGSGLHFAARDYAARGLWGTAILHWQKAIVKDPCRLQYQFALINAYIQLGDKQKASDLINTIVQNNPQAENHIEMGRLRARLGHF
ncbi:MAG: hypothetical protein AAF633_16770 [Chloroflexota bacterium]